MGTYEDRTRDQMIKLMDGHINSLPEDQRASATFGVKEYSYPYESTTYHALFMYFNRLETDEEERARMTAEATMQRRQEARERAEYERLKKKFD